MTTLLKVQSSLFGQAGQSSVLVDTYVEQWLELNAGSHIISRDLAANPMPHLSLDRFQAFTTKSEARNSEQQQVVEFSDTLIAELKQADVLVLGVPMYNFKVPSVLSTWFDHITRAGITFQYTAEGPQGLLTGKKAVIFITRGGFYGESHSQTQFLSEILGFIGIVDVEFIYAEGLATGDANKTTSLATANNRIEMALSA